MIHPFAPLVTRPQARLERACRPAEKHAQLVKTRPGAAVGCGRALAAATRRRAYTPDDPPINFRTINTELARLRIRCTCQPGVSDWNALDACRRAPMQRPYPIRPTGREERAIRYDHPRSRGTGYRHG